MCKFPSAELHLPPMARFLPWVILLAVAAIWGAAFALIKYLVGFVGPYELVVLRFVPVTLLTVIWIGLFYRHVFARILPRFWWIFLALSGTWVVLYHMILNVGETVLPASAAGLIISTYPVFTVLVAAILRTEKLTWARGIGGLVALTGTALLTILGATDEAERIHVTSSQWITYSLFTLIAPISAACTTLATRRCLVGDGKGNGGIDSLIMTLGYMAPSGVFAMAFYRPELLPRLATVPVGFWLALGALVLFCTVLSQFGWFWVLQNMEAGPAAISTYLIPIFSLAYARIWLNEPIRFPTIIAAVGIVAGVVISSLGPKRAPGEGHTETPRKESRADLL